MRFEIKELQRTLGITILYVTHDQEIALAISDRLAIMDEHGAIRQVGSPPEIYEHPADSYVFRFLGMANFLPVRRDGQACQVAGSGQPMPGTPPDIPAADLVAGFRPSDVRLSRTGEGLKAVVKRVSFLGAVTDFLIEVDGHPVRTNLETHHALSQGLLFAEGDPCVVGFHGLHWFDQALHAEGK
jgi:iron(III) transport system ATP-binding protein